MLDSTDPPRFAPRRPRRSTTLFILASKSGTTIEPNSLAAHFQRASRGRRHRALGGTVRRHHRRRDRPRNAAHARSDFRDVFINPSDIGGRYSALSFFGMVPAALMGQDLGARLAGPSDGRAALGDAVSVDNPGCRARARDGGGAQGRARQADAASARSLCEPLACGSNSSSRRAPARTASASSRSRAKSQLGPSVYGSDRLFVDARLAHASTHSHCRHRVGRSARAWRGIRSLGNRDRHRWRAARHQPVRRAERPAGERCDKHAARRHSSPRVLFQRRPRN